MSVCIATCLHLRMFTHTAAVQVMIESILAQDYESAVRVKSGDESLLMIDDFVVVFGIHYTTC